LGAREKGGQRKKRKNAEGAQVSAVQAGKKVSVKKHGGAWMGNNQLLKGIPVLRGPNSPAIPIVRKKVGRGSTGI